MVYRIVEGDGLRTSYSDDPSVIVDAVRDGPVALEVSFPAEPGPDGSEIAHTRLRFEDVMEYRWVEFGRTYLMTNPDDFEFALIEIVESPHIARILDEGRHADQPPGQRLGGVVHENRLRHYRIGFDHYGTFDVICLGLRIERFRAVAPA